MPIFLGMITHHHPDHAGLTQEIKKACDAHLIIHEKQIPLLEDLKSFYAGKGIYLPIQVDAQDLVLQDSNRGALNAVGVRGEIIRTPGHSDDSVSLVLDSGKAFIGDLHRPDFVLDEARSATCQSWKKLISLKASIIYPAHGNPFHVQDVSTALVNC